MLGFWNKKFNLWNGRGKCKYLNGKRWEREYDKEWKNKSSILFQRPKKLEQAKSLKTKEIKNNKSSILFQKSGNWLQLEQEILLMRFEGLCVCSCFSSIYLSIYFIISIVSKKYMIKKEGFVPVFLDRGSTRVYLFTCCTSLVPKYN